MGILCCLASPVMGAVSTLLRETTAIWFVLIPNKLRRLSTSNRITAPQTRWKYPARLIVNGLPKNIFSDWRQVLPRETIAHANPPYPPPIPPPLRNASRVVRAWGGSGAGRVESGKSLGGSELVSAPRSSFLPFVGCVLYRKATNVILCAFYSL